MQKDHTSQTAARKEGILKAKDSLGSTLQHNEADGERPQAQLKFTDLKTQKDVLN